MIEQEDKNKLLNFEPERFNNVIKLIETYNVRGKRSELIGFYCAACDNIHEDYLIKNIRWICDNMACKESQESIDCTKTKKGEYS